MGSTLTHLARQIWRESSTFTRIMYFGIVLIPPLAAQVVKIPIEWAFVASGFAAMAWLIFLLGRLSWRQEKLLTPAFATHFDSDNGGIVVTPTKTKAIIGDVQYESRATYVRATVRAVSKKTVVGCEAYLTDVKKSVSGDGFHNIGFTDPIRLGWALDDQKTVSLPHGVPRFANILVWHHDSNKLAIDATWPLTLREHFKEAAIYRLKVTVAAEGVSDSIQIDVTWTGPGGQITATQVKP